MQETISNNKRIAKNTLMLYIRMLLSVVVSLYTSRVVLEVLGVEDYGIYGVVGGVVAMFSFLNSTMAGATSRFLTYEMGLGDENRLKATFSSSLIIHIAIALIVLVLSETIGLWFLNNKLIIPENRMYAAHWVFQFSVLGMMVGFTQVPYNAAIIAHEKMDVYAYVELLNVFLKLGIVYLLSIGNFDKLILYALLVLVVSVIIAVIYRVYCVRRYKETRFSFIWDKGILAPMFVFSGWEMLAHLGYTFRTQGVIFVLNMSFGVVINAVTSIATTVQNTLSSFSNNVLIAIKPQIIKRYALGNVHEMLTLVMTGIRFNLLIQLIITLPIIFSMDFILTVWLKNPPEGCVSFCQVMLCSNILSSISQIIYSGIQATGKLKFTSICRNIIYIATPICIYIAFSYSSLPPIFAYILIFFTQVFLAIIEIFIFKNIVRAFQIKELFLCIIKVVLIVSAIIGLYLYAFQLDLNPFLEFICITLLISIILVISFYLWIFNDTERQYVIRMIKKLRPFKI